MSLPLFDQAPPVRPGKTDFRAVFFFSDAIWLVPNDLARFQLQNSLQGGESFARNFVPRISAFSALEAQLAREISPPEIDPLHRRLILNGLAADLADALNLTEPGPAMLADLAESLGDGLDRLKLAAIPWEKLAGLKPARLALALAAIGRRHDEAMGKLGRADQFTRRQMILKLLAQNFPFRALEGISSVKCHWSQRLSPFETDLLSALSLHYEVDVILNIPKWARNEDLAHASGFDIVRSFKDLEKHTGSNKLFLSFSEKPDDSPLSYAAETLLAPPSYRRENPPDPKGHLGIRRAATAYQEVEDAARRLKELIVRGKSKAHDLALAAPDLISYGPLISDVGRRFGLSFHFRRGESLASRGPARAVLELIALWSSNWERPRVLRLLKSPYFTLTNKKAAELRRLALCGGVTDRRAGGGFEMNLTKLLGSETEGPLAAEILENIKKLKGHGQALAAQKTWPDFFAALGGVLKGLGWPGAAEDAPKATGQADLAAAEAVRGELDHLSKVFLSPYAPRVSLENFRLWLGRVLEEHDLGCPGGPEGRVWALNYYDIHGGIFDEIFFLGLNERLFPQTGPRVAWWPDEFLKASAGASFLGRPLWSTIDDSYRQEELMLATGLGQARRRVHLYYHKTGDDGRMALPSPLLGQLKELWPELVEDEAQSSLPPPPELMRGEDELWAGLISAEPETWPDDLPQRDERLGRWRAIRLRHKAWQKMKMAARPGEKAVERWLGQMENIGGSPLLRPEFLKNLADCPLAFWLGQGLGLTGDGEPLEEWPKNREGTLLHRALEKFFSRRLGEAWPGDFDFEKTRAELMDILRREISLSGPKSPLGRLPLWEARVKKLPKILTDWLRREEGRPAQLRPLMTEWAFGTGEGEDAPAWPLPLGDNGFIYFKGRADRVDDTEEGLMLRDYKLRESAAFKIKGGQGADLPPAAYPLAVYMLAASRHLGRKAGGSYEFISAAPEGTGSLPLPPPDPDDGGFNLPEHLRGLWVEVLGGIYEPSGHGCDFCPYQPLCPLQDKGENNNGAGSEE